MKTAIKPFPACHFTHASVDAALALRDRSADFYTIDSVIALAPAEVVETVCKPVVNKQRPANSYDAQFSIAYLVAAAFRNGRMTLTELEEDAIQDPQTLDLAKRITYQTDLNSPVPKTYSGELIVTLKDGTELRHREHINRGADERPLTNSEIVKKYNPTAAVAVPEDRATAIRDTILALDTNTPLTKLLRERELDPSAAAANLAIA
jgi:2-methylcitrate dehydratase PrpD